MTRESTISGALSATVLIGTCLLVTLDTASALTLAPAASPQAVVVPAVSSNAHKGAGGRYGGLKGAQTGPSFGSTARSGARKQPYPYKYYDDTSRGNYGCERLGRRAIETDNDNWWARYRACTEVGGD